MDIWTLHFCNLTAITHSTFALFEQQQQFSRAIQKGSEKTMTSGPSHQHTKRIVLRNAIRDSEYVDTLQQKAYDLIPCSSKVCTGFALRNISQETRPGSTPRNASEVLHHAKDFLDQYYTSVKRFNSAEHNKRWDEIVSEVSSKNTYQLTETELVYGAKLAWRNASNCTGRIQWNKLQVFDARFVTTAGGMFQAICDHIKYATNKGSLRSAITVFPQRTDGKHDYRIWNSQIITYAGYRNNNETVVGDPANVELTDICLRLGWKGSGSSWDVLPVVVSADGQDPEFFDLPKELILEVPIKHQNYPAFDDLNLKWYAVPAVSNMVFDVGGVEFPSAPFSGWYTSTEIGCRDLGDPFRYNMLEKVAIKLGLDTNSPSSLWKDKAMLELNIAVVQSFRALHITIFDHHTASEAFMKHFENEQRLRGGCPANWLSVVPPMTSSATPVFHQEMLSYTLKPNFEYQDPPWKTHIWKKRESNQKRSSKRKFGFKHIARAVKLTSMLFGKALSRRIKAVILYATETGRSENYAKVLGDIFSHAFNAEVLSMAQYDVVNLEHETLLLVVTSTFGNGDPPDNGEEFAQNLYSMKVSENDQNVENTSNQSKSFIKMNSQTSKSEVENSNQSPNDTELINIVKVLGNLRFAVCGLGSSAYPNFCAFGKYVDNLLSELGGERLLPLKPADELSGQEPAFKLWAKQVFQVACDVFCVGDDISLNDIAATLESDNSLLTLGKVRLVQSHSSSDVSKDLSKILKKSIVEAKLITCESLTAQELSPKTVMVKLSINSSVQKISFSAGDHIGVCPMNRKEIVDGIMSILSNPQDEDRIIEMQILKEQQTVNGLIKNWIPHGRLPPCTVRTALENYLDVTTPPTPQMLEHFAFLATDKTEAELLNKLSNNAEDYENWKSSRYPNLLEVLQEFPSVAIEPTALLLLLPLMQPRFYSISSSPSAHPDQIHLTVGVITYQIQNAIHYGVCSNYLSIAEEGTTIHCFIRVAQNFHLPEEVLLPVIMVGPGTGIAPFRSFWQEKEFLKKKKQTKLWPMSLYTGCRTPSLNLYQKETGLLNTEGILQQVHTAYSRVQDQPKLYVQHLMCENSKAIYQQLFVDKGHFYVCGDVSMAEDVNQTLRSILASFGGLTMAQAENYLLSMRDENRYHEDVFGITFRMGEVRSKRPSVILS